MQFKVNFTDNINLTYDLINHEIVDSWVDIINTRTINDLCPNNHYIGYVSEEFFNSKIQRLYDLVDYINNHTPDKVIKCEINRDNYQTAINTMHVHFPTLKNDINYKHIWEMLTEYNDIIHWIESTVKVRWGNNNISESGLFRITLDFNKSNPEFRNIPDSAYKLFDPHTLFGELKLHYTHVGRNAHELFIGRDELCPVDQFIPQRLFTASVRMYFTDDFYVDYSNWNKFYNKRGRDFWGIDINDPKIAFGYMKIGQLSQIVLDGNELDMSNMSRHDFRNRLSKTKILGWEII